MIRHLWFAWKCADVLMLTRFGSAGRSEDRDDQQDEEEQVEDPHCCLTNLVNEWVLLISPSFSQKWMRG